MSSLCHQCADSWMRYTLIVLSNWQWNDGWLDVRVAIDNWNKNCSTAVNIELPRFIKWLYAALHCVCLILLIYPLPTTVYLSCYYKQCRKEYLYVYLCTHRNLHKEFLEVRFLYQSVCTVIILIGTGKMNSVENTNLHDCPKFMRAYSYVSSCYNFFLLPIWQV